MKWVIFLALSLWAAGPREIEVKVTDNGYEPAEIHIQKGEKVDLLITRTTEETCAVNIQFEGSKKLVQLPMNKQVRVSVPATGKAGKIKFGCSMKMMIGGVIIVE